MVTIKRPKKPPEKTEADGTSELVTLVIDMVKGKELDPYLIELDTAITTRITTHETEKAATAKKTTVTKPKQTKSESIAKPPVRKSASKTPPDPRTVKTPELVVGKTYLVDKRVKQVGGAKVSFVRVFKKDEKKSVVKMVTDTPGFPKGKMFPILTTALQPVASTRRVAKSNK